MVTLESIRQSKKMVNVSFLKSEKFRIQKALKKDAATSNGLLSVRQSKESRGSRSRRIRKRISDYDAEKHLRNLQEKTYCTIPSLGMQGSQERFEEESNIGSPKGGPTTLGRESVHMGSNKNITNIVISNRWSRNRGGSKNSSLGNSHDAIEGKAFVLKKPKTSQVFRKDQGTDQDGENDRIRNIKFLQTIYNSLSSDARTTKPSLKQSRQSNNYRTKYRKLNP